MHYQGYQSNNKQPAGPLILHISESCFLKFFHNVGGGSPLPHPPLLACCARPRARFTRIMRPPPAFKVAPKPMLYDIIKIFSDFLVKSTCNWSTSIVKEYIGPY